MNNKKKLNKDNINKNIRIMFFIYLGLLALCIAYLLKFLIIDKDEVVNSSINPRVNIIDSTVQRGTIYDKDGQVLAVSIEDRVYPYDSTYAHTVGFTDRGLSGIESAYSLALQHPKWEIVQRTRNLVEGEQVKGSDIYLTMDTELQELVTNKLNGKAGSIIVLEPSTGKVLAMASSPTYNPNNIADIWDSITSDSNNSVLVNRSTDGLYPPGSVFKIITALAYMRYDNEYEQYVHNCTGSVTIDGETIRCYDSVAHGEVDLSKAMIVSCNTYFASLSEIMPTEEVEKVAQEFYFNKKFKFDLPISASVIDIEDNVMQSYIGQGDTLVTPINMAIVTQAVANNGIVMQPYMVEGVGADKVTPTKMATLMSIEEASVLNEMLKDVINVGTAQKLNTLPYYVAGKTGSAENGSGADHGWFVGYAPADNPQVAVVVVYENIGGSKYVLGDVYDIFDSCVTQE